jgi:hypothetical protein
VSSGAWNRHDIEVLASFMRKDGIFVSAGGTDACGTRHQGAAAARKAFAAAWETAPDLPLVYPNVLAPALVAVRAVPSSGPTRAVPLIRAARRGGAGGPFPTLRKLGGVAAFAGGSKRRIVSS